MSSIEKNIVARTSSWFSAVLGSKLRVVAINALSVAPSNCCSELPLNRSIGVVTCSVTTKHVQTTRLVYPRTHPVNRSVGNLSFRMAHHFSFSYLRASINLIICRRAGVRPTSHAWPLPRPPFHYVPSPSSTCCHVAKESKSVQAKPSRLLPSSFLRYQFCLGVLA